MSTGTSLELYRLLPKEGRLAPLFRCETFSQIRALSAFRLPGTRRDYLIVTSDAGTIAVLSPDPQTACFRTVHAEPFGRTGCRRAVPGQFLAAEPRGRACMVGAIERAKFAYVLNHDSQDNLTISSPLEAHRSSCATFALHAIDVGFENPVFVSLERAYNDGAHKELVYYELDLGLNHVVKKLLSPVRSSSFVVLPVPGHTDGPGGVLVCSAGYVSYINLFNEADEDTQPPNVEVGVDRMEDGNDHIALPKRLEAALPFRHGTSQSDTMIVCGTAYHDRKGNAFFFMLCTEHGDLIKAELTWSPDDGVTELRLVYFDSLPAPAVTLTIFRSGYLFVVLEGYDALLLKFKAVDVPDDDPAGGQSRNVLTTASTDATFMEIASDSSARQEDHNMNADNSTNGAHPMLSSNPGVNLKSDSRLCFTPRSRLTYLVLSSTMESLAPILSMCNAVDVDGESAVVMSTGRGKCANVRVLRRGTGVIDMSSPYALLSKITNVFTFKDRVDSAFHRYIVVSFRDRTKVLLVGDTKVEETFTSGLELSATTLCAGQISENSLVQVHSQGVRFIRGGSPDDASEWKPPVPSRIIGACCNNGQVVIALSSGTIVYFEVDLQRNALLEVEKIQSALVPSGGDAYASGGDERSNASLAISEVPPGRRRASFFAVGDGTVRKVRLYRVNNDGSIEALGVHLAPAPVESLAFADFGLVSKKSMLGGTSDSQKTGTMDHAAQYEPLLSLVIGTKHGAVVRLAVDGVTGSMGDKRSTFIGPDRVRVRTASMGGIPICFVLGSRPHILFAQGGRIVSSPLGTESIQHAASFSSEESPDGFVAAHGSKLRLLSLNMLHAFQAGAEIPAPTPAGVLPASTTAGCMFQLSRSQAASTVRRMVRVAEQSSDAGRKEGSSGKRPRSQNMFVVIESDHRVFQIPSTDGSKHHEGSENPGVAAPPESGPDSSASTINVVGAVPIIAKPGLGSRQVQVRGAGMGYWSSRMILVRIGANDGADTENEYEEFDGSNPLFNFSSDAVSYLDSIPLESPVDCFLCAASTCAFVPEESDSDTVSYIVASYAHKLVVSATERQAENGDESQGECKDTEMYGALSVYRVDSTLKLRKVHETRVENPVYAMAAFRDMVVVGVGSTLRLYSLGKRQLLRKMEYRFAVPNGICSIAVTGGDRLFVADNRESVTLFKYIKPSGGNSLTAYNASQSTKIDGTVDVGRLVAIASDEISRWVTCLCVLDYNTVCGGDKFGNVFVLRLPIEVAPGMEEVGVGASAFSAAVSTTRGGRSGTQFAKHRLHVEACMHVGSVISGVTVTRINGAYVGGGASGRSSAGGKAAAEKVVAEDVGDPSIVYGTMDGAIGVIAPLQMESDVRFARSLEMVMRKGWRSVVGRDHLSFRSSFYTSNGIIDGDFCELFFAATTKFKEEWANAVGRSVNDITRKLEELRAGSV